MKKFFITIIFCSLFSFLFNVSVTKAVECTWTAVTTTINMTTYKNEKVGGCGNENPFLSQDFYCTKAKPEATWGSNGGTNYVCCCASNPTENKTTPEKSNTLFQAPDLKIEIPGLDDFSDINCVEGEDCEIPWLGQYIKGVYNYAIAIAGILAAVVLMGGGLLWLLSRGDTSKITQAKELIIGSLVGLIILSGSYLILTIINPRLVNLDNIKVSSISPIYIDAQQDVDMTTVPTHKVYEEACTYSKTYNNYSMCESLGEKKPEGLIYLESEDVWINAEVSRKYLAAMECVKDKNNGQALFKIGNSWRSPLRQVTLRKNYDAALAKWSQSQTGQKPTPVAFPCCSNHGSGYAMDLNRLDKNPMSWSYNDSSGLKKCMNDQGLYANIEKEPWHWSLTGY